MEKRDVPASEAGGAGGSEKLCPRHCPGGTGPVSYTHLDVYKRQVLDCKETATSRESFIRLMNERGYGVDWKLSLIHI